MKRPAWAFNKKVVAVFVFMFAALSLFTAAFGYQSGFLPRRIGFGLHPSRDIKGVLRFLDKYKITGNMFNQLDLGSFIIWEAYPKRKVFIDGRVIDCYPPKFFVQDYVYAGRSEQDLGRIIKKFNISYFILTYPKGGINPVIKFLLAREDFALVFWDDYFCVFASVDKFPYMKNKEIKMLMPFYNDNILENILETKKGSEQELEYLYNEADYSFRLNVLRGIFNFNLRDYKTAKGSLLKVLSMNKFYQPPTSVYFALGVIAAKQGKCGLQRKYFSRFLGLKKHSLYKNAFLKMMQSCIAD